MREPIAMCFSGGKDSSLALQALQRGGEFRVETLITTVTDAYDRVSMHGVRRSLVRTQAASLGIPLAEVVVPAESSNEVYEHAMGREFDRRVGIRRIAFGDIFLEDLREYRERQLAQRGLEAVFPLWRHPTARLAPSFIRDGFAFCNLLPAGQSVDKPRVRTQGGEAPERRGGMNDVKHT